MGAIEILHDDDDDSKTYMYVTTVGMLWSAVAYCGLNK